MDLFEEQRRKKLGRVAPLPVRMRPRNLDEFAGQTHFLGEGKLLRRMIQADRLTSLIFYGPPGTGKTTLAEVIANITAANFRQVNATGVGVKEIRDIIAEAKNVLEMSSRRTVLFIDELHRFNRAQQDVLLEDVESGVILLIGATTQNPFFSINGPLLSRSQIFQFQPLIVDDVKTLLARAVADRERGLGRLNVQVTPEAMEFLATICDGDARKALSALEVAALSQAGRSQKSQDTSQKQEEGSGIRDQGSAKTRHQASGIRHQEEGIRDQGSGISEEGEPQVGAEEQAAIIVDLRTAQDSIQRKAIDYDATGDQHYDIASAFIKSMRGSDPDAAIYWLARMLEAGEDPRFIARRIVILASEDIGNADPFALVLANAAAQVTEFIGLPECQLTLAQAVTYLACSPKSNASSMAIWTASDDVKNQRTVPVPVHLRDAHYKGGVEQWGHGKDYKYAHNYEGGYAPQDYLGVEKAYYQPSDRGREAKFREYLERLREIRKKAMQEHPDRPDTPSQDPSSKEGPA